MSDKDLDQKSLFRDMPSENRFRARRLTLIYWIAGISSLVWLIMRSGSKPRRLAYPCQQVAATNSLGFLGYLAALLGSAKLLRRVREVFSPGRLLLFVFGLLTAVTLLGGIRSISDLSADSPTLPVWTSPTAISDVFVVSNVPEPLYSLDGGAVPGGVDPDDALHDEGIDALVGLMESEGDYFYKTTAHADGLFASDDVVVIKVNNQWDGRNGTNTDVVKGIIYRLVQHPEGFTGAVIIAENTQNHNDDWYNELSGNNSQFQDQSYLEVVQAFAGEGYPVCLSDWKAFRDSIVDDFDAGDNNDGYVLEDADDSPEEQEHLRLSYPKFQANCSGTSLSISMKQGLWDGSSFDNEHLKMINVPVLKRHNAAWATISMKNYLGFITTFDPGMRWVSPGFIHCWLMGAMDNNDSCTPYTETYGLVGRQFARIRRADLNIVDAIWVNPRDNASYHGEARRQDVILASRDPFAVDYYSSDYLLYPLVVQFGNTAEPEQVRASYHGGWFRNGLLYNVARLRAEGITDTINIDDSMTQPEEEAQFNVFLFDHNGTPSPTETPITHTPTPTQTLSPTPTSTSTQIPSPTPTNTPSPTPTSPPINVEINGPHVCKLDTFCEFEAVIDPGRTQEEISFSWSPEPTTGQGSDIVEYIWDSVGLSLIQVIVQDADGNEGYDTHQVLIFQNAIYLPVILQDAPSLPRSALFGDDAQIDVTPSIRETLP